MGVNEDYKIYICHAGVLEQAKNVQAMLESAFENADIEIQYLSPVYIAQGGPGCIAVQTIRK